MRAALFALMAVGAAISFDVAPAEARDYPICMRTRYDTDECNYTSYAQCMATASGLGQTCFQNPALAYYRDGSVYGEEAPPRRHRHHRRPRD